MAKTLPNAIFVGRQDIGQVLASIKPEWNFLPGVETIADLWTGLNEGTITNNIQIILILDTFFDPTGQNPDFENLVAIMAPYCFLGIVNYRPEYREQIREKIQYTGDANQVDSDQLLYYFIDPKQPHPSIAKAIIQYAQETKDTDTLELITGQSAETLRPSSRAAVSQTQASYGGTTTTQEPSPYLGQLVAVTSSKGGSGKSTIAVMLATYLAHASINSAREGLEPKPLKICLLDIDIRDGQIGFLTGHSKPTVIDLSAKGISPQSIQETVIHNKRLKCDLILAARRPRVVEVTPPEFYVELIHELRRMYDYVILDTSVNYLDPLLEKVAYPMADQIVFVTDIVINSIFSMTRWIQEVTRPKPQGMGINPSKIGIVVNKSMSDINMDAEQIAEAALDLSVITIIPQQAKIVAHAANMQSMDVLIQHPNLRPAIRRLAHAIVGKKYKLSQNIEN